MAPGGGRKFQNPHPAGGGQALTPEGFGTQTSGKKPTLCSIDAVKKPAQIPSCKGSKLGA